jgi:hypothetical protein
MRVVGVLTEGEEILAKSRGETAISCHSSYVCWCFRTTCGPEISINETNFEASLAVDDVLKRASAWSLYCKVSHSPFL